jgi:signal transduction histidine kinase
MAQKPILKILVADDDKTFVSSFRRSLEKVETLDVSTDVCDTETGMLDSVYRHAYDLIFLDVALGGSAGLEVLSRVGQTSLPLPIVVMADSQDVRSAVEAMKRGALDYLMKEDLLSSDLERVLPRISQAFRLRRENAELKQINLMKDDFLATISHELRTPLTSILGLCEVLLTGRLGPMMEVQTTSLNKILVQTRNLVRLINQLLDIRNFAQASGRLEMELLSFRSLLKQRLDAHQDEFHRRGIRLSVSTDGEDPLWVRAQAENLTKTLDQILLNALKFTPRDGSVTVETRKMDPGYVRFQVTDTGHGIPPEALPHVFEKFFHVDKTLTRPYGGMGLGLALCKEVVEAHGGRIWVESKGLAQGATTGFLIPAAPAPPARVDLDGWKPETRRAVLWVDDNPDLLELMSTSFKGLSMPVDLLPAQRAKEALEIMSRRIPDLVILDIMMPDMDGLELMELLKKDEKTRRVPVLVVSGYKPSLVKAMERGASDVCLKPFQFQDIFKKIEMLLTPSSNGAAKASDKPAAQPRRQAR